MSYKEGKRGEERDKEKNARQSTSTDCFMYTRPRCTDITFTPQNNPIVMCMLAVVVVSFTEKLTARKWQRRTYNQR